MWAEAVETSSQRFWLSAETSVAAQAREALATSIWDLEANADNICAIATELVTCSLYGLDQNGQRWAELVVTLSPHTVRIGVSDASTGFDPARLPVSSDGGQVTGALEFIDDLVDRWGVEESNGETYVWFEVDRH
jgi:hypothetical protein